MDKIEQLEKRISELEKTVNAFKEKNKQDSLVEFGVSLSMKSAENYERHLLNKFSIDRYKEIGLKEDVYPLDFSKMLERGNKARKADALQAYKEWKKSLNTIHEVLGKAKYFPQWYPLTSFVKSAVKYYEQSIIERVLKEGKHFEGSGNRPQWNPENTAQWFDELYPSFSDKKTMVYNEIRKRHNPDDPNKDENGVPNSPSERTIRNQLKEAGRI